MAMMDGRLVRIMDRYTPTEGVPSQVQEQYEEYINERIACGMEDTVQYLQGIIWVVYRRAGEVCTLPEEEYRDLLD